jgi:hypothetical protein
MYERGVLGGALNLDSTSYPDHGRYGDLQDKILKMRDYSASLFAYRLFFIGTVLNDDVTSR